MTTATISKPQLWTGRILSGLAVAFFLMDAVMKLFKPVFVVQATVGELGFPESVIIPLGVVLLTCTVLYVIPRTAILGAVLLTGYLGGAIASKVRINKPGDILFTLVFAVLVWLGLYLRDLRVRNCLS